jgi:linoleate 10R-lipoxygenase
MIMERTIQLVAALPNHSRTQEKLTNSFIDKLWNSLDHPPLLYIGPESKYRRPDGAYNVSSLELAAGRMGTSSFVNKKLTDSLQNPTLPFLGARGHTYSRSCKPKHTQLGAQPDPAAIYEAVMARDGFRKNPNNTSSILWYWATIIIHGMFVVEVY